MTPNYFLANLRWITNNISWHYYCHIFNFPGLRALLSSLFHWLGEFVLQENRLFIGWPSRNKWLSVSQTWNARLRWLADLNYFFWSILISILLATCSKWQDLMVFLFDTFLSAEWPIQHLFCQMGESKASPPHLPSCTSEGYWDYPINFLFSKA